MKYNEEQVKNQRDYLIIGPSGCGKTYFVENNVIPEILKNNYIQDGELTYSTDILTMNGQKLGEVERFMVTEYSTYEDLFGSYMPMTLEGKVSYEFVPGPFARALKGAYVRKKMFGSDYKQVLLIENITNGNAYEIFGSLFQLLDRNKAVSEYPVSVQKEVIDWFKQDIQDDTILDSRKIYLPDNLYIICTMNGSSSANYRLDTAFRRRFRMVYIMDDGSKYGNIPNNIDTDDLYYDNEVISIDDWDKKRKAINEKISAVSEDKLMAKRFIKFNDDKIGILDFVIAVYGHLLENVYRTGMSENKVTKLKSVEEALIKCKECINTKSSFDDICKELFKL